jgi:uncharacterized membrane protein
MPRPAKSVAVADPPQTLRWLIVAALVGLGFSLASTWVHYQIIRDPLYSSVCDVNSTISCTEAYTSQYGTVAGIPVALIGVVYFGFVLLLIALCQRSYAARQNLSGYVFAVSTLGLAVVLYLAYASFFVLNTVCPLCLGTYAAIIALFLLSGAAARYPMSSLPSRASSDVQTLVRTPAALGVTLAFVAAVVAAVVFFPGEPISASGATPLEQAAAPAQPALPPIPASEYARLEAFLAQQPRKAVPGAASGAAVVIYKFNDYQCPPCRMTFLQYKPFLARLQQQYPGKIAFITRDFPLDPECNVTAPGGSHIAACEAAVAVRLAREKGRADAMEDWLFANQPALTPDMVKQGAANVGGVGDFEARYSKTVELVKADIAQGVQLGVGGTPTFFMNGMQLPNFNRGEFFEAAVLWELRRLGAAK